MVSQLDSAFPYLCRREQQKLRDEVERLTAAVAGVDEGWAAKLSAAETTASIRIKELEAQIERLGQDKVS